MNTVINESDMSFVVSDKADLFYIEDSKLYKRLSSNGVSSTEYLYLNKRKQIRFVEAKKTCPNKDNMGVSKEKYDKYEKYYQSLTKKVADSMSILTALLLDKQNDDGVGDKIASIHSLKDIDLFFVLVIKEADEKWLGGVKAELDNRLRYLRAIWKIETQVLNEELARIKGIVN